MCCCSCSLAVSGRPPVGLAADSWLSVLRSHWRNSSNSPWKPSAYTETSEGGGETGIDNFFSQTRSHGKVPTLADIILFTNIVAMNDAFSFFFQLSFLYLVQSGLQ